ncbi:class I SAM-dependent methyltransferase [Exilibacterium tricleocarpae]|uniref:Class I SAM-dependent methyltransferase n=1 Tax=Exilibacterium tricleocarpae TaxID=2591008 RepID=A0A545SND7_9GAMM|nr:class I SAM-dependent methyltransferase [Exilibacterium tricleocarpae]TQV66485.1 class I SAM-dependent methyltransferase [Exilibacterium tricleocarpae]
MLKVLIPILTLTLVACSQEPETTTTPAPAEPAAAAPTATPPAPEADPLEATLAAQSTEHKARYAHRNPRETLEFFGIEPGMTVVEALPGGGWYTKILLPYLGTEGALAGVDYALDMWPKFGFFSDEQLEAKKTWIPTWTADANTWRTEDSAEVSAFVFGSMPEDLEGSADAVLFIRALHNLNRFENDGGYLTTALGDAYRALKPGGIVGVVQHEAPAEMPDDWADGSKGYLKRANLIASMEAAGFEYVDSSDINANPNDQPTTEDVVWRLPPMLFTSRDNPELRAQMQAVGESNRMTLKFRKPG